MILPQLTFSTCCWAHDPAGPEMARVKAFCEGKSPVCKHWSRQFEYPWVLLNGAFKRGQWCLDAGGGDAPLGDFISGVGPQVVSIDCDLAALNVPAASVLRVPGDLRKINVKDEVFDRVVCVSVLEHMDRPWDAVHEMWRVLAPGGKLLLTFDVASYARWNHTIDLKTAEELLAMFGQKVPRDCPAKGLPLWAKFDELDPKPGEPREVLLQVVCVMADKSP